jgi:hypothetical protein
MAPGMQHQPLMSYLRAETAMLVTTRDTCHVSFVMTTDTHTAKARTDTVINYTTAWQLRPTAGVTDPTAVPVTDSC